MPTIKINGLTVNARAGATVLQAAAEAGFEIPHYCYHPGLTTVGSCRMCQVDVEGIPKLQIACNTPIKDGMVVTTNNEKVKKAQNAVMEFLLLNHPLDCPVCDQAGECGLQDYYMRFGRNGSRLADNKVKREKAKPIGPTVMLDQERCILCSRCIRFCQEVPKTAELGIFQRGDHSVVDIYPGLELNNKYSGNVVDICPVGALTDRDFRFQVRVWYLRQGDSICTGCSRGCNMTVYHNPSRRHHAQGRRIARLKPRFNPDVNKWWICDEGRYQYRFLDENRLLEPTQRTGGEPVTLSWDDAMAKVAAGLRAVLDESGPRSVAVLGSAQMPNEDLYLARKFFGQLGITRLAYGDPADKPGSSDNILITADKNPNRRGAEALAWSESLEGGRTAAGLKALIVFRQDLEQSHTPEQLEQLVSGLQLLVFIGTHECGSSRLAHFALPAAVHVERDGTFTNVEGRVQRFFRVVQPMGEARAEWQIVTRLAAAMGVPYTYRRCEEVFEELAQGQPPFSGLTYPSLGKAGQPLAG